MAKRKKLVPKEPPRKTWAEMHREAARAAKGLPRVKKQAAVLKALAKKPKAKTKKSAKVQHDEYVVVLKPLPTVPTRAKMDSIEYSTGSDGLIRSCTLRSGPYTVHKMWAEGLTVLGLRGVIEDAAAEFERLADGLVSWKVLKACAEWEKRPN